MADQDQQPPAYATLLDKAEGESINLNVIKAGVHDAEREISRQAAMQMAEGLYPASFFAMLNRLNLLNEAIKVAQDSGDNVATFTDPAGVA